MKGNIEIMNNIYFKLDDNFETIIKNSLIGKEIHKCNQITTGWTNIVYEVETNEGNYFFRFPRDEFWSRTIVKDCEFAKYIHNKTNFETSNLQLKYDDGRPFSMHKKIPGVPLAEKMNDLTKQEVEQVADDIAKFMYELHKIDFKKEKIFSINNIGLNLTDFLEELLTKHVAKEDMEFWKFVDTEGKPECLVHGDLNSSNVLLDNDNKVTAIIDFGFSGYGDKYDDLSRIIGRCPDNFKNEIVKSYEMYSNSEVNTEQLDSKIKEWSNIDQAYINYMRGIGIYE